MTAEGEPLFTAIKEALSRTVPEFDQVRVGRRVREAYAASRTPARSRTAYQWAFAAFAGVALVCVLSVIIAVRRFAPTTFEVAGRAGSVGSSLEAQPSQPLPLIFSEGSRVLLSAGSRGRVSEVTANGARVELERGSVSAEVVHRKNTQWTFVAGPFEVAVLGTRLGVSWAPQARQFELTVTSGAVRVRGPLIAGGREVRTGQVFRIDLERGVAELGNEASPATVASPALIAQSASVEAPVALPSAPAASASIGVTSGAGAEPQKPAWVTLAEAGRHRDAVAAAERAGLPSVYSSSSSESLLELARAARHSGHPDVERAALLACRKRGRGQSAAQAAYLLGRASAPTEAVTWFETYIHEQPRGMLAREAAGRLIESYVASRNTSGAKQAAAKYLAEYPNGPHASMARQVLGSDQR
jgi:TolA-binding protein